MYRVIDAELVDDPPDPPSAAPMVEVRAVVEATARDQPLLDRLVRAGFTAAVQELHEGIQKWLTRV